MSATDIRCILFPSKW